MVQGQEVQRKDLGYLVPRSAAVHDDGVGGAVQGAIRHHQMRAGFQEEPPVEQELHQEAAGEGGVEEAEAGGNQDAPLDDGHDVTVTSQGFMRSKLKRQFFQKTSF